MLLLCAVLHGLGVNEVAVVVVEYENVLVAADGGREETAGGIGIDLASGRLAIGIEEPSFEGWGPGGGDVVGDWC